MNSNRSHLGVRRTDGYLRRLASGLLVVVLLMLVGASPAGADSLDELRDRKEAAQKKREKAQQQIKDLEHDLEDTDKEMAAAYVRLKEIEAELPVAQAALEEAEGELDKAKRVAADLSDRLDDAVADEADLVERLEAEAAAKDATRNSIAELARRAYRGEGNPDGMSLIVGAQSAEEFVSQFSLSQTAMRTQTNSLDDLKQAEATSLNTQVRLEAVRLSITDLKKKADAAVVDAEEAAVEAQEHREKVEGLIEQQRQQTAKIESRRQAQLEAKKKQEKASAKLTDDILEIIGLTNKEKKRLKKIEQERQRKAAAAARKAAAEARKNGTKPPAAPSSPSSSGKFLSHPTTLRYVTSNYGWRMHPVLGYERLHAGTDFRAYCGTPIMAAAAGTVVGSHFRAGYGNQVLVNHGTVNGANLMTSYNHLSRFSVSAGQKVKKGQVVGYSGNTGTSSACHLHFEVYVNGATVNPLTML